MREIKFRAWDKSIRYMMDVGEIHFCAGGLRVEGTGVRLGNGWATETEEHPHDCDIVLMQYTDLKDKHGVEIYEGDVLATDFAGSRISGVMEYEITNTGAKWSQFLPLDQYEIIGNIYENPELLNQTEEQGEWVPIKFRKSL